MSADPHPSNDQQRLNAALMQLVDVGTTLLDAVAAKAKAGADLAELAPHYDTIGRGIRKTVLLVDHLARPAATAAPETDRVGARKRILREVEDTIHQKARAPAAESLRAELAERLDSPDLELDIKSRPLHEIVRDICRDFGLLGPFQRRTPLDIQDLFARAATPSGAKSPPPKPDPRPAPEPEPEPEPEFDDDGDFEPQAPLAARPLAPKPHAAPETAASLLHYLTRSRGT